MNVKKQAVNDATVLFAINAEFWKTWEASRALAIENPKYDEVFTNTYNNLSKKFVGKEGGYDKFIETVVMKRRSKKPALVGVVLIVGGAIWLTGYDKVLLEKGKHLARKAVLALEGTNEEQPKHSDKVWPTQENMNPPQS